MKTLGESFGFEKMLTVFVPGFLGTVGLIVLCANAGGQPNHILTWFENQGWELSEWQQTFGAVLLLSVVGSIIGSLSGVVESQILDRITPLFLWIQRDVYLDQWYNYVESLSQNSNPYIARVVFFFQFELRTAVGLAFLAICLFVNQSKVYSWIALAATGIFLALALTTHYELGTYRKRLHSTPPAKVVT